MTTRTASKRPENDPAVTQPHAATAEQPHAAPAVSAGKGKGGPEAGTKRTTASPSRGGMTPAAKAHDAHSSGGRPGMQPHAAPRMGAWEGGGSRSSIFDAAGGGGTRGLDVAAFPQLASMAVSPPKASGPSQSEMQVVQPHAPSTTPGAKTGSYGRSVLRQRFVSRCMRLYVLRMNFLHVVHTAFEGCNTLFKACQHVSWTHRAQRCTPLHTSSP